MEQTGKNFSELYYKKIIIPDTTIGFWPHEEVLSQTLSSSQGPIAAPAVACPTNHSSFTLWRNLLQTPLGIVIGCKMHCGKWCIHHTIFLHAPNPSSTLCAQSHTPLIKNIIKLQPPLHHIYTGKHTSLVTVGDTAKPATIVKLFRLPLEKTFLYIS